MTLLRFTSPYLPSFDHFFENNLFDWSNSNYCTTNTTLPSVNILEEAENFVAEVAAPEDNEKYTRKEYSYQSFTRSFRLPKTIDGEKISAKYDNGILQVTIPKKEEAKTKPVKEISIQ